MARLNVNQQKLQSFAPEQKTALTALCPFNAIELHENGVEINAGCKMCKICVRTGPEGVFEWIENDAEQPALDKSQWKGIAVYIDHAEGRIHPVSLELIGKAKELAAKVNFPVYALYVGHNVQTQAEELLYYGVDEVFVYDYEELAQFSIEPYANAFENFIQNIKPSSILVGATPTGRSLAPRVAARMRTGLTADCTKLDMKDNTDLVQIRPAFGGNIMAQICTPNHRPQMATIRYKIFSAPPKQPVPSGKIHNCTLGEDKRKSRIKVVDFHQKEAKKTISEADAIVAVGRGIKAEKDLAMAHTLAQLLGAEIAATRPLIESGWIEPNRQIGLSGRTVKPKLIFTLGISGSVQFKAGMENSDLIISINTDEHANIFDACHYAVKGDLYDIIPKLIEKIEKAEGVNRHV